MCHFSLKALSQKGLFHQPSRRRAPSLAGFFHPRQRAELPEPRCLTVSLRTAQQGQHKGAMSFTVQWKVKAERKLVITAFQLAVEMLSPLIFPSCPRIDIFPTQQTMLVSITKTIIRQSFDYHLKCQETVSMCASLLNNTVRCHCGEYFRKPLTWPKSRV